MCPPEICLGPDTPNARQQFNPKQRIDVNRTKTIRLSSGSHLTPPNKPGWPSKHLNVHLWPKADTSQCTAHVRFRGQSRHDFVRKSAFAVAIGGKADIAFCGAYVCF